MIICTEIRGCRAGAVSWEVGRATAIGVNHRIRIRVVSLAGGSAAVGVGANMAHSDQRRVREDADARCPGECDSHAINLDRAAEGGAHVGVGVAGDAIAAQRQHEAGVRGGDVMENSCPEPNVLEPDHAALRVQATAAGAVGAQFQILDLHARAGERQDAVGAWCIDDDVARCAGVALDDQIVDVGLTDGDRNYPARCVGSICKLDGDREAIEVDLRNLV